MIKTFFNANYRDGIVKNCSCSIKLHSICLAAIYAIVDLEGAVTIIKSSGLLKKKYEFELEQRLINELITEESLSNSPRQLYINELDKLN